jgi:hypothetical protein
MNGGELIGLAAVVLTMGIPIGAMYTYFRVRRLKSEERMAAIARGIAVPMEPELTQVARSRRAGILLVCTALGYTGAFSLIGRVEPDAWVAAAFGLIPFAIGVGFFVDSMLVKRDLQANG